MQKQNAKDSPRKASLSVVVIGKNEGEKLTHCLNSVHNMHRPEGDFELLYVDSASTDDSVTKAQALKAKVLHLKELPPSAASARNVGWKATKGEFVLFLDGDSILDPNFVLHALSSFDNPNVGAVCGILRERHPGNSIYNKVIDLDWIYPLGEAEFCGGNALIRRKALEDVGGFDPSIHVGEEPEMCWRMRNKGYRILNLNTNMISHDIAITTFRQYWKRAFRTGYGYAQISHRFAHTQDPLWGQESRQHLTRGGVILIGTLLIILSAWLLGSFYPLVFGFVLALFFILRTSLQASQKAPAVSWTTWILYGCHSHFLHIPILMGQITYYWNSIRKRKKET